MLKPCATFELAGVTPIAVSDAAETVALVEPLMALAESVALIVAEPCANALNAPWLPLELLIVPTLVLLDAQLTDLVTS